MFETNQSASAYSIQLGKGGAMKRRTGIFTARGDDGQSYTIYEYTDFIEARSHDDPTAQSPGLTELRTRDGMAVNWRGKGVYQILTTGVILKSTVAGAP
jgi:hypothetical protein